MRFWRRIKHKGIVPNSAGPAPWYLRAPWLRITTNEGTWSWETYDDSVLAGLSRLVSPIGDTVLFVDTYCYVQPLSDGRLVIWYEIGKQQQNHINTPSIEFVLLHLNELKPLNDIGSTAKEVKKKKQMVSYLGGSPVEYSLSTILPEEVHLISPPAEFTSIPELLVLADYGPASDCSNHSNNMCRAIFACDFKSGRVEILPQAWFNEGDYDFGYQWITRVQREPVTGHIVGEGIRLGSFRLDASGTQLKKWISKDLFYHPGRDWL